MANKLTQALLGAQQANVINPQYTSEQQQFLNDLNNQAFYQALLNQPKETALTDEQYKQGIMQGLNYGVPQIAEAQKRLNINVPKTSEDIALAQQGAFNQYPTTSQSPNQGGFINDVTQGFRENLTQPFDPQNLQPQNKSLATKIGEGLGTATRFLNSPLGRGLLAGGAIAALGGSPAQALGYGTMAGVTRQGLRAEDQLYRQQLINMGVPEEEVNQIQGNVTKDMYSSIASGLNQLAKNVKYSDLAPFDEDIQNAIAANPDLADRVVPSTIANTILQKKGLLSLANIDLAKAKTAKTKKETEFVGKPRVSVNVKKGGTTSIIKHEGGSGGKQTNTPIKVNTPPSPVKQQTNSKQTKHKTNAF